MKFLAAILGGGMFGLIALMQQAGTFDLGEVGEGAKEIGQQAASIGGSAVDALSKGLPFSPELMWFSALIVGVRVVIGSEPVKDFSKDRRDRAAFDREERAKAAEHARQLELERIRRETAMRVELKGRE